jgi:hypothetical protein
MVSKEEAYDLMSAALHSCTEEGTDRVAVVIMMDNDKGTVRVYGLNIDSDEVPQLLVEVAEEVYDRAVQQTINKKLNS